MEYSRTKDFLIQAEYNQEQIEDMAETGNYFEGEEIFISLWSGSHSEGLVRVYGNMEEQGIDFVGKKFYPNHEEIIDLTTIVIHRDYDEPYDFYSSPFFPARVVINGSEEIILDDYKGCYPLKNQFVVLVDQEDKLSYAFLNLKEKTLDKITKVNVKVKKLFYKDNDLVMINDQGHVRKLFINMYEEGDALTFERAYAEGLAPKEDFKDVNLTYGIFLTLSNKLYFWSPSFSDEDYIIIDDVDEFRVADFGEYYVIFYYDTNRNFHTILPANNLEKEIPELASTTFLPTKTSNKGRGQKR